MNDAITHKPYREQLRDELEALQGNPEVAAIESLRNMIASALADLDEVGGKDNAQMVIWEVEDALEGVMETTGVRSIRPSDTPDAISA